MEWLLSAIKSGLENGQNSGKKSWKSQWILKCLLSGNPELYNKYVNKFMLLKN